MKKQTIILLGVIFCLLLGVYIYLQRSKEAGLENILLSIGKKEWEKADKIEVFWKNHKGFKIVKKEGKWIIQNQYPKPAKEILIKNFLSQLAHLSGEKRAEGEKFFSRFDLTPDKALHLVLYKEREEIGHILIGKRGPQWTSSFIRLKDHSSIYLVPLNLLARFEIWSLDPGAPEDKGFIDLEILNFPYKELKEISFQGSNINWKLYVQKRQDKEIFIYKKNKAQEKILEQDQAKDFYRHIFPLYAQEVVNPKEFISTEGILLVKTKLGQEEKMAISCSHKKDSCLIKKGPFVYKLDKSTLKALFNPKI